MIKKTLLFLFLLSLSCSIIAEGDLPSRDQIDAKYKWDLTHIYSNDTEWENDFEWLDEHLKRFSEFKGKLGDSPETLLQYLNLSDETMIKFQKLGLYAHLGGDIDLSNGKYQTMQARMAQLGSRFGAETAFAIPEILSHPWEKVNQFLNENEQLSVYRHSLEDLFRTKAHSLSEQEEKILAQLSPLNNTTVDVYNVFSDAEMIFPSVEDESGSEIQLSHGRTRAALYSNDRDFRKRAYEKYYVPFADYKNTIAALFNGRVKERIAYSKIRNYENALESALESNAIPVEVYDNLVETVNENLSGLHRWAKIKKDILKLDELHPYDVYASLFPAERKMYTFDEARGIVLEALKPLGEEYQKALVHAFNNNWIDVYETKGKRSGGYSTGYGYGVHPFILLNWNGTMDDMFTLAHELGHNMHSYFADEKQPFVYAGYTHFLAEVASTTNEALLLDYLLSKAESKEEKLALMETYLLNVQSTVFRQTRFAEFEKVVHEKAENGEFLDAEGLSDLFLSLYKKYWGEAMTADEYEGLCWARVSHFYIYDFYVYQYSTGFVASQAIVEKIKREGQSAVDDYLNFLYNGDSVYSIDNLKTAGVDMTNSEPIELAMKRVNQILDQMEELIKS